MDVANVSATRRKKESAKDSRPSAQAVGMLSTILVCALPVIMILTDIPTRYKDIFGLRRNLIKKTLSSNQNQSINRNT